MLLFASRIGRSAIYYSIEIPLTGTQSASYYQTRAHRSLASQEELISGMLSGIVDSDTNYASLEKSLHRMLVRNVDGQRPLWFRMPPSKRRRHQYSEQPIVEVKNHA